MATIVLDHTQDVSGRDIHRLTALYPPPAFVKDASHERLNGDPETLPTHVYAYPKDKLYPCHSAPATWTSTLFYLDKAAHFNPDEREMIEAALEKAAAFFGIAGDIAALRERVAANVGDDLTKLANDQFAIVWEYEDKAVERHWPLRNAAEVKFAAMHFVKHRDDFEFDDRFKIANKILDKAMEYGAGLEGNDDVLTKAAGRGACSARDVATFLDKRAQLVAIRHPDLGAELTKLAGLIRENPAQARGHDKLVKLASILDGADRMANLVPEYAQGLTRPEDVLFQVTEKQARDFVRANVETTTGNVYALDELEKASVDSIREWMGDDFADAVTAGDVFVDGQKLASILPTLDRGAAGTFDRCMAQLSIQPIATQKAASENLLSQERLFALAGSYRPSQTIEI